MPVEVTAAADFAAPQCNVYGRALGSVTPGDIFYIKANERSIDNLVTLYITNTDELSLCYRYLTLEVGIYVDTGEDQWRRLDEADGLPATFITLRNGLVSFYLPGLAEYKIMIDGGCFYCLTTSGSTGGSLAPEFYLTVE